ncbi:MAG: hypothetical protein PHY43_03325 [Verrucomicrobiales bacterium]|nr:hypothetical protein [Verrucomicrobiales bacterium]
MSTDDPRIKRVLKRYLKNAQFSEASLELAGISLRELQAALRCASDDNLSSPRELDEFAMAWFTNRMQMAFEAKAYDYFVHSYIRREFCSSERVPPDDLRFSCEDGPPKRIPMPEGYDSWVSARPENGQENYIAVEDEPSQSAP